MKQILITATKTTPEISADNDSGVFTIAGVSAPENPQEFYASVQQYFQNFIEHINAKARVRFNLLYFNSSSAKFLFFLMKQMQGIEGLIVEWCYESGDSDLLESGEDYQKITGLEFLFIEKPA